MQEIRNSRGFSCGKFLQLVIKGLHYAEVKSYFAIVSPLCQQASKKEVQCTAEETGKDCIGENTAKNSSER